MEDKLCIENIKDALQEGIVEVIFIKKDGTERVMKCTTNPALIAKTTTENIPTYVNKEPDLFRVTDIEKNEWRSFRFDQIKSVKVL